MACARRARQGVFASGRTEAKEFPAGFWIIDCESPKRAIEIAGRASAAPGFGGAPRSG